MNYCVSYFGAAALVLYLTFLHAAAEDALSHLVKPVSSLCYLSSSREHHTKQMPRSKPNSKLHDEDIWTHCVTELGVKKITQRLMLLKIQIYLNINVFLYCFTLL